MSCPNATAPIDVGLQNITGKCDLKCDYSFSYSNSSCIATNRGDYLALSYDSSTVPPVLYNAVGYNVTQVRLYTPSLHAYSGNKTDGELIIVHQSNAGTKPLLVCIPIKINNSTSPSSSLFRTLINTVAKNAPADGDHTQVNLTKYNLSEIVPHKPFFTYSATEPYQPCTTNVDYIVFDPLNFSLDIDSNIYDKLQTIIKNNPYNIKTGPNLFYNEKGPSIGDGTDQIYIDCQPVGESEETYVYTTNDNNGESTAIADFISNPTGNEFFRWFLWFIIGLIIFFIIYSAFTWIIPYCSQYISSTQRPNN